MSDVIGVKARFRRQIQPVQYQSAEAEIEVTSQFTDKEYREGRASQLLLEAKIIVLTHLGLQNEIDVAMKAAGAAQPDAPAPKPVAKKAKEAPASAPQSSQTSGPAADPAAVVEPASASAAGSATAPAADAGATKSVTDEELQKAASAAAGRLGKGGAAIVKEKMKAAGVARLGELPQEKRLEFVKMLEELKKPE